MGLLMSERFQSLKDVFSHELMDVYDAENQLVDALPKMAEKASNPSLKRAFQDHLAQTRTHVKRLESVFKSIGMEPDRVKCAGMAGLISEGSGVLSAKGDNDAIDAALIGAAQRVEHYEMAVYGTLRTFANRLGNPQAAGLLEETLEEEKQTDKKLTEIAEAAVNPAA
jgi:ferritin-like metal-binding protein YciE